MQQIKKSQYRQRVYQMADASIQLVFGDGVGPDGAKLLADHDVAETCLIQDHVEPAPAPEIPPAV